jgi:hypothetical protein
MASTIGAKRSFVFESVTGFDPLTIDFANVAIALAVIVWAYVRVTSGLRSASLTSLGILELAN